MTTKEQAYNAIKELVEHFERDHVRLTASNNDSTNETQTRREFIDPFFEALGWDVSNKNHASPNYREVLHEDKVIVRGSNKNPDYSFRLSGGQILFFVEAKQPKISLLNNAIPALQLRSYGWSAKLNVSILTDFEEFIVYDCTKEPKAKDTAAVARIKALRYTDYLTEFEYLWETFSKQAVLQGSFDAFSKGKKRGAETVDKKFLKSLDDWRVMLAIDIAKHNKHLDEEQMNIAVQTILDRIIFLRIAEDRGLEEYENLKRAITRTKNEKRLYYAKLLDQFGEADNKYNSGLFDMDGDDLTPPLTVSDVTIKTIIEELYFPNSPYQFSVISVEILGQAYEQFLGKSITLARGHKAEVEYKPEVRKAGGVYYTPAYIVQYIVENTVGKLCQGKTPQQVAELTICDPACGSGSFLLGAYQYLLNWHIDYYTNNPKEKFTYRIGKKTESVQPLTPDGQLITPCKKAILLNNIYGVDIDRQAVEVTKLSLLLKCLEGETTASVQTTLSVERILPSLEANIKCGNSLVEVDFYDGAIDFEPDAEKKIKPFNWKHEFKDVFKRGGFDAVIGNPPYIRIQTMLEWMPNAVKYYSHKFKSARSGNYDIYVCFVEQGLNQLNKLGLLGYILPHKFFNAEYGLGIRQVLTSGKHLKQIILFGDIQIFEGATTYTCLLFLAKNEQSQFNVTKVDDLKKWRITHLSNSDQLDAEFVDSSEWNFALGNKAGIIKKLQSEQQKLSDVADLFVGLQTDADDVFILEKVNVQGKLTLCKSKATGSTHWLETAHLKNFLKGSVNIRRYYLSDVSKKLIFPYQMVNGKSILIDENEYKSKYPLVWKYLMLNKERLSDRNKGNMGSQWYGYVYKKNHTKFGLSKILVPSIALGSCFAEDLNGDFYFVGSGGGGGGGYGISMKIDNNILPLFLLGVLNSSLVNFYIKNISTPFRGGYYALNKQYIETIPLVTPTIQIQQQFEHHVEQMLQLHREKQSATGDKLKQLEARIAHTDDRINALVYELYGLTEEEINIVEGRG